MKNDNKILTKCDVLNGVENAIKKHQHQFDVLDFLSDKENNINKLYNSIIDGNYKKYIAYRQLEETNADGKLRKINSPVLLTRIMQHVCIIIINRYYKPKDADIAFNCKKGYGITAKAKRRSLMHRLKHLFFDLRTFNYILTIDQRKCYEHIKSKKIRKCLKELIPNNNEFIDFVIDVCMLNDKLPIGTPSSPLLHHVLMRDFDCFVKTLSRCVVRYADNLLLAFETKEEANNAKWRIKNFWWYKLNIRAKRHEIVIKSIFNATDFCGNVYHRNKGRNINDHDKGFVTIRERTKIAALKCRASNSYSSYFGLLKHADCFSLLNKIERKNMKLNKLTEKIRINRQLDAKNIDIREIDGKSITIYDYEIRSSKGVDNWIKFLVGIEETSDDGKPSGRILAREFHGNYQGLIKWIREVEKSFDKSEFMPIEEATITNQCGYIFIDSTNQLKYIENEKS